MTSSQNCCIIYIVTLFENKRLVSISIYNAYNALYNNKDKNATYIFDVPEPVGSPAVLYFI